MIQKKYTYSRKKFMSTISKAKHWDWAWKWTAVYFANTCVPIILAASETVLPSRIGMCFGIATLWIAGLLMAYLPTRARRSIIGGSLFLGVTQFFPICQFMAGMFAIVMWDHTIGWGLKTDGIEGFTSGFAITVVTGQILLFFAILIASPFVWLASILSDDTNHL